MGSPMPPSHLTLSELNDPSQGHSDFKALYLVFKLSYAIILKYYYKKSTGKNIRNVK